MGAIGIFDSGVGGLTVLRSIAERLPGVPMVYLGDTARVPYGAKSRDTVIRYARACAELLLERDISMLVVACNTASAFALDILREELDVPVLGVIEPGARDAVAATRNQCVGVIGTAGTVRSGAYQHIIRQLVPSMHVVAKACPLFVPLAEEGWTEGPVPLAVAGEYLNDFRESGIDTLVLGCTHYPLLRQVIGDTMGKDVALVDSADATSRVVAEVVSSMAPSLVSQDADRRLRFLVTDAPEAFAQVGRRFLGHDIGPVEWVDVV